MVKKENMERRGKKKIAVTGNQGYIGSVLTQQLVESGYRVLGIDAGIFEDVQMMPRVPATVQKKKDIRDIEMDDIVGCDAVIHLAGLSNDPLGELDEQLTYEINYRAGVRLAELAKRAGVNRFLFSSSCSTYGVSGQRLMNENDTLDPKTAYAKSKVMMEDELRKMSGSEFTPVILRNATVFGYSPRLRLDLVVNDLTANGYTYGRIKVLSDGTPWRPSLAVNDCARAFIFLLEAAGEQVSGEAFNIGTAANNHQVKDIARLVKKEIVGSQVFINPEKTKDERTYRVSFDKIERLGWKARELISDGVRGLLGAFDKVEWQEEDMMFNGYYTLKRYQAMRQAGLLSEELRIKESIQETV